MKAFCWITLSALFCFTIITACTYRVIIEDKGREVFKVKTVYTKANVKAYYRDDNETTLERVEVSMIKEDSHSPATAALFRLLKMGMNPLNGYLSNPGNDEVNNYFEE